MLRLLVHPRVDCVDALGDEVLVEQSVRVSHFVVGSVKLLNEEGVVALARDVEFAVWNGFDESWSSSVDGD